MPLKFLRALFLSFLAVLFFSTDSFAQQKIGVEWNPPSNDEEALTQLTGFADMGISDLIISKKMGPNIWAQIDSLGFNVHGNLPILYPVASTFTNPDSAFLAEISTHINFFVKQPSVRSIGVFKMGQTGNSAFIEAAKPIIQQIDSASSADIFYTSMDASTSAIDSLFDYKFVVINDLRALENQGPAQLIGGYIYALQAPLLGPVKQFLELTKSDSLTAIFDGPWLLKMTGKYPSFKQALSHYAATSELVFPLPKEGQNKPPGNSLIVILLLSIFGMFVLNYQYSPIYKKTLSRYFLGHTFLVNDIMNRHIRTTTPALVILFQHVIATGITAYSLGHVLFSASGWMALNYHYPNFFITGDPLIAVFLWACLLSLHISIVSTLWIRLTNKQVTHFSQVLLLYSWPLQLNFMLTLVIVTLMISGFSNGLLYLLGALFFIILLGAFIITAYDTSHALKSKRVWFLFASVGVYSAVLAGLIGWILSSDVLLDVLSLAYSLP